MKVEARNRVIRAIHVAGRGLFDDDEQRRDLIANRTGGKRSCADCTDAELLLVLDWMNYLGGRRSRQPGWAVGGETGRQVAELRRLTALPPAGYMASPLSSPEWIRRTLGRWAPEANEGGGVAFERLTRRQASTLIAAWRACDHSGRGMSSAATPV